MRLWAIHSDILWVMGRNPDERMALINAPTCAHTAFAVVWHAFKERHTSQLTGNYDKCVLCGWGSFCGSPRIARTYICVMFSVRRRFVSRERVYSIRLHSKYICLRRDAPVNRSQYLPGSRLPVCV